jgi:hypothetical protein
MNAPFCNVGEDGGRYPAWSRRRWPNQKERHRGVQAEEFVLEAELSLSRGNCPTLVEKPIEHLLVELPGTFLIRVGQRVPGWGGLYVKVFQLPEAA